MMKRSVTKTPPIYDANMYLLESLIFPCYTQILACVNLIDVPLSFMQPTCSNCFLIAPLYFYRCHATRFIC